MTGRKTIRVIVVALVMVAMAGVSVAQGPQGPRARAGMRGEGGPGGGLLRMREYLGLTDQQVNDMKALVEKHKGDAEPLVAEVRAKREALRAALDAADPNATTVGQLAIAVRAAGKQLRALSEKLNADMLQLLTQEQKDKLLERGPGRRGPRRRGPM